MSSDLPPRRRRPRMPDPLLGQVLEWVELGEPVETIAARIRCRLPDQSSRVPLVTELRRQTLALQAEGRLGRAQYLERVIEAMEQLPGA